MDYLILPISVIITGFIIFILKYIEPDYQVFELIKYLNDN